MTAKTKLIVFFSICFLVGVGFLINLIRFICPFELVANSVSSPIVTYRENDLLYTNISQIVSDEKYIYILFGDYGVVQLYTHDGSYQYSISVYNHMNGRTKVAAYNNCLYICDKVDNVYVFQDGEFIRFVDRRDLSEISAAIIFGRSDPNYSIRGSSVWYAPNGVYSHCIVERPLWLSIYQNDMLTLILFALAILAGGILFAPQRVKHP